MVAVLPPPLYELPLGNITLLLPIPLEPAQPCDSRSLLFSFAPWAKSPHSAFPPCHAPCPRGSLTDPAPLGGPACLHLGALLFQLQPHTSQKGAASTPHPQHLWSLLIMNSSCSGPLRRDEAGTLQAFQIKAPSVRRTQARLFITK